MTSSLPTRGQLERSLTQRIQALYRNQLGHRVESVACQIFDHRIALTLENSITQPEQLLANSGNDQLAEEVRSNLNQAIEPQIRELVEEVLGVSVVDFLSDAKLDTGRTGIIMVLSGSPRVRDRIANNRNDEENREST